MNTHNSELNGLFNKWCSDKGTYWLSKHNYGVAYDAVLAPIRHRVHNLLEMGVGDETAGSLNSWREFFPKQTHLWIVDYDKTRFLDKSKWSWASRQKRRHGCMDDKHMWTDPRVHSLFGVDSSNATMLRGLKLPDQLDVIIDDAAHVLAHQVAALEALWPRLAPGGIYIVEDVTVGSLPWLSGHAAADQQLRVPSNNSGCGHECQYAQRPAEHPFIKRLVPGGNFAREAREAFRLGGRGAPAPTGALLSAERILDDNAWYWATTGAHVGGGVDATIVIRKAGGTPVTEPLPAAAASPAAAAVIRPLSAGAQTAPSGGQGEGLQDEGSLEGALEEQLQDAVQEGSARKARALLRRAQRAASAKATAEARALAAHSARLADGGQRSSGEEMPSWAQGYSSSQLSLPAPATLLQLLIIFALGAALARCTNSRAQVLLVEKMQGGKLEAER